jgi:hypothetical protein
MRPGQLKPNDLEVAILARMAKQEPFLADFIERLQVLSRQFTGVGSFTNFKCDQSAVETPRRHVSLDALITMPRVPNGLTAVLFLNGAYPECLEICTFGDDLWDGVYDSFAIE